MQNRVVISTENSLAHPPRRNAIRVQCTVHSTNERLQREQMARSFVRSASVGRMTVGRSVERALLFSTRQTFLRPASLSAAAAATVHRRGHYTPPAARARPAARQCCMNGPRGPSVRPLTCLNLPLPSSGGKYVSRSLCRNTTTDEPRGELYHFVRS